MKKPALPPDEPERLETLHRLEVLDTPAEEAFDNIVRLAAQICGTPIALVSLIDRARQWFKARVGLKARETPREVSFCGHAILQPDVFVVPDALEDQRFSDNPLVRSDPKIRFYAGTPLRTSDGHAIGTLCVIDRVPRNLTAEQQTALGLLGREAMAQLQLRRALSEIQRAEERIVLLEEQILRDRCQKLVGTSAPMREVYRRLQLAARTDVSVLLTGESGTGKELAAAAIHSLGARKEKPFVAVNCAALPETLLESELFGHVRGAFTGAVRDKTGLFQAAEGGTLFLDEVGDLTPALQVKLLRALDQREVRRVGDDRAIRVDVRLVCATNRDLARLVAQGAYREDFYYRIRVFEITLPPLRARRDDIPLLARHFLNELSAGGTKPRFAPSALRSLLEYPWPGNVRELRNAVEHALVTADGTIGVEDFPPEVRSGAAPPSAGDPIQRDEILSALKASGGRKAEAARKLGMSRVTLWKKLKQLGLDGRQGR